MKFLVTLLNIYFVNLTGQAGGAGFTLWNLQSNYSTGQVGNTDLKFYTIFKVVI